MALNFVLLSGYCCSSRLRDLRELDRGTLDCCAGSEPADAAEIMRAAIGRIILACSGMSGSHTSVVARNVDAWHDTNHRVRASVDHELATDDRAGRSRSATARVLRRARRCAAAPFASSPRTNARPRIGETPITSKKFALTRAPESRSGSPPVPVRLCVPSSIADIAGDELALRAIVHEIQVATSDSACRRVRRRHGRRRETRRAAGSGSSNTPFTMLKTAVVAPIASESVPMTIAVNPGVRISLRAE